MNNEFFPDSEYKLPVTSNYMKFQTGENTFRVLSSSIVGWEYWNTENKPIRNPIEWNKVPDDIKTEKDGSVKINHFWAFVVWNYEAKKVQILEVTQKTIMQGMQSYIKNQKWSSPKEYDFIVNRVGSGLDTEYSLSVNPKSPIDEAITIKYKEMDIKLNALFTGGDPFGK